ncbi:MAG TPA: protein kinase [Bryobacteraceae bacterium]|nr:protein kinase [Bryobacteraceae bacterium]
MTPERWSRIKDLFLVAIDTLPEQRQQLLAQECKDDVELQEEVRRLIIRHETPNQFLDGAAISAADFGLLSVYSLHTFAPESLVADRFLILSPLGAGGMGEVYHAHDTELSVDIALKTIRLDAADHEKFIGRFKAEVNRARQISSPNVCRIHDLFVHTQPNSPRILFLTMELLHGETLSARLAREGPVPVDHALPILRQICAGLQAAHDSSVLHLDLKSSNVMICREESGSQRVVISDFGLARQMSNASDPEPLFASSAGTLANMAPEQLLREPVSPATDVYSLGILTYQIVTGRHPFPRTHSWADAINRLNEQVPPPSSLVPGLGREWDDAIARAMSIAPSSRFQSAEEFLAALRPMPRTLLPRRALLGAGLLGAAAATVAGALYLSRRGQPDGPIRLAVLPFASAPEVEYLAQGLSDGLREYLSHHERLIVPADDTSRRYASPPPDTTAAARRIGTRLQAHYVLMGILSGNPGNRALQLSLIGCPAGRVVYQSRAPVTLAGIAASRQETARAIETTLGLGSRVPGAVRVQPVSANPQAQDQFLMGLFHWNGRTEQGLLRAKSYFEETLRLDPTFVLAHCYLSYTYMGLAEHNTLPPLDCLRHASLEAERAYEIDPRQPAALTAQAQVRSLYGRNLAAASQRFRESILLDPGNVTTHLWYSAMLAKLRLFDRALAETKEALRLDPLSVATNSNLLTLESYTGAHAQVLEQGRRVLELDPHHAPAPLLMALSLARLGRRADALRMFGQSALPLTHPLRMRTWVELHAALGDQREARRGAFLLATARRSQGAIPASYVAIGFACQGMAAETFRWIEIAFAEWDAFLPHIHAHPAFDPIRKDPRYPGAIDRLGITAALPVEASL